MGGVHRGQGHLRDDIPIQNITFAFLFPSLVIYKSYTPSLQQTEPRSTPRSVLMLLANHTGA